MRTFTAPCGTSGCIDGLRCATVCALDASMCMQTPVVWPTSAGGLLTSQTGAQVIALRFITGGDLVGVGWFAKDVTVGGATLQSTTSSNGFVFRIGRDGNSRWAHSLGAGTFPGDVRIAANGDLVVATWIDGAAIDLGNGVTLPATSDEEIALARYNQAGVAQSAVQVAHGNGVSQVLWLALAPDDSAVLLDQTAYDVTFGTQTLTGNFKDAPFVVALDATWAPRWGKLYTSDQGAIPLGMARTSSGDVVFAAEAFSPTDFGSGPLGNGVLVRLASDGTLRFAAAEQGRGPLAAAGDDVVAISYGSMVGEVYVSRIDPTGATKWRTDLDANLGGSLYANLTVDATGTTTFATRMYHARIDGHDFFGIQGDTLLAQLDVNGHYLRGRSFGGQDLGITRTTIDVASDGTVLFGGYFYDPSVTVDYGAGQWVAPPQPTPSTYVSEGYYVLMQP